MIVSRKAIGAVILACVCSSVAYAVPPAYYGEFGNAEEPAMRPYKWLWRGICAFVYQPVESFRAGNVKMPVVGTVETVRGVRRGSIELGESAFKGLQGSVPPRGDDPNRQGDHYRELSSVNRGIEEEPFLSTVADAGVIKLLDKYAPYGKEKQAIIENQAKAVREARMKAAEEKKPEVTPTVARRQRVKDAQRSYLGDRYVESQKEPYKGNILKVAR